MHHTSNLPVQLVLVVGEHVYGVGRFGKSADGTPRFADFLHLRCVVILRVEYGFLRDFLQTNHSRVNSNSK
jgi:hypothetical protein